MLVVPKKKIHLTVYLSFNMKIIIAGYGFVGKAVANAINKNNLVYGVDPILGDHTVAKFTDAEGVIICVGTPSTPDGDCDISQIISVMDTVSLHLPVLIKSTVPPHYLEKILKLYPDHSICYSPEFLRAVSANEDFLNQKYMVIGGDDPEAFWQEIFQESLPNCKLFFNTSITEASMIKYSANSFLSAKLTFFNQIYDLCQANGSDYKLVRQILTHDHRIGNSHMLVPGPDGERGFGGACFPKDTKAFINYANDLNIPITVLEEVVKYNEEIRKKTLT
jgi:UDPglucose 6-dehydrogenase